MQLYCDLCLQAFWNGHSWIRKYFVVSGWINRLNRGAPPNVTLIRDRTPLIAVTLILPFARCTQECPLNRPKTFPVKSTRRYSFEPAGDFTKQTPRQEQPSTAICVYVWVHIRVWVFGCVDVSDLLGNIQVQINSSPKNVLVFFFVLFFSQW